MASEIKVKEKEIVVPGEVLAEGMGYLPSKGTFREGDKIIANKLGMVVIDGKVIKLVQLSGRYIPKIGDVVIGKVIDVLMSGWRIELNCPYTAMLSMKEATSEFIARGADLTQFHDIGDYLVSKITNVTSQKLVDVSLKGPGLKKLRGGRLITVNTNKVPRIIGKQGSMVSMLKNSTGCRIVVGQNGLIWIDGEPEDELLVVKAIKKIENESHVSGLTDNIKKLLEEGGKKVVEMTAEQREQRAMERQERPRGHSRGPGRGPSRGQGRPGGRRPPFRGQRKGQR